MKILPHLSPTFPLHSLKQSSQPATALPQRGRLRILGTCALATLIAGTVLTDALAQTPAYPNKPIRVIVPFPPGGGGDTLARLVMSRAGRELGQPIVFENISGAGGNIGAQTAARAPADGYTLLYGTNGTHGINMSLYKSPGYDAVKSFEPISQLTRIAAMLVVRPTHGGGQGTGRRYSGHCRGPHH